MLYEAKLRKIMQLVKNRFFLVAHFFCIPPLMDFPSSRRNYGFENVNTLIFPFWAHFGFSGSGSGFCAPFWIWIWSCSTLYMCGLSTTVKGTVFCILLIAHVQYPLFVASFAHRVLQRDVVYLCWPIAPSYMIPNAGEGGGLRGLSQWVQLCTSRDEVPK